MSILKTIFKTTKKINAIKMLKKSILPGVGLSFILATCFNNSVWASAKKFDDYALLNGLGSNGDLGSNGSLGAKLGDTLPSPSYITAQQEYEKLAPNLPKYASYNPGGFDCRNLIGNNSNQTYTIFTDGPKDQFPFWSSKQLADITVSDPDHDFKVCLMYQFVEQHEITASSTQLATTNMSPARKWPVKGPGPGYYEQDDYFSMPKAVNNPLDFTKTWFLSAVAEQADQLSSGLNVDSSSLLSSVSEAQYPILGSSWFDTLTSTSDAITPSHLTNTMGLLALRDPAVSAGTNWVASSFDSLFKSTAPAPWQNIEDYLGYSSNLTVFNDYLDEGVLFKDGGMPKIGKDGNLTVGWADSNGFHNDFGLLTTTTKINLSGVKREVYQNAISSGLLVLKDNNIGGKKLGDLLQYTKWDSGTPPMFTDFINAVLSAGTAASMGESTGVKGYLPGTGFYNSKRGYLVDSSGDVFVNPNLMHGLANAMCLSAGNASSGCRKATFTTGDEGIYNLTSSGTSSTIIMSNVGIPVCGAPRYAQAVAGANPTKYTASDIMKYNDKSFDLNTLTSGGYDVSHYPSQPYGNSKCLKLLNNGFLTSGVDKYCKDGDKCNFEPPKAVFGVDDDGKLPSWWRVGESYLVVNQLLAQNVQRLVDAINNTLDQAGLTSGLKYFMSPFDGSGKSFSVNVSQKLEFTVEISGGINAKLHLIYIPSSVVNGDMNPLSQSSQPLDSPFSTNSLALVLENKDLTKNTTNQQSTVHTNLSPDDAKLIREVQGLPDSLARPLEYYTLFYRVLKKGSLYKEALQPVDYNDMKAHVKKWMDTLVANSLADSDIKGGTDNTETMSTSINSALSAIYTHITPASVGGGSISYINPVNIERDLQSLYSFGDSSGQASTDPGKMIGKQYDFLTQIQQLGVHMIGDVVDNLYQIGDAYTKTFNDNTALIDNNLSNTQEQLGAVQSYEKSNIDGNATWIRAHPAGSYDNDIDIINNDYATSNNILANGTRAALGLEAIKNMVNISNQKTTNNEISGGGSKSAVTFEPGVAGGTGEISPTTPISGKFSSSSENSAIGDDVRLTVLPAAFATIDSHKAEMQRFLVMQKQSAYREALARQQLAITSSGMKINNMMLTVEHKQMQLQQMSYQMMVNMTKSMMLLPLAFVVLTMLFTAGMQFALIIPMTPYIIFWAGQTSWLINTIEAMIAAPLVGLALLHPGGHAYYGHTIQGYKMLINVVLKPVLLVFGTLASMVLVYIIIVYSAQGFHMIGNSVVGSFISFNYGQNADGTYNNFDRVTNVRAILSLMMIFMYSTFLTMVFNKCFSVIYVIPEKVVGWVGGQADNFGKEASQHLAQATQQETSQVAQAGQQSTQSVAGGAKEMSSSKGQSAQSQEGSGVQMAGTNEKNVSAGSQQDSNSGAVGDASMSSATNASDKGRQTNSDTTNSGTFS